MSQLSDSSALLKVFR